jgi:hypothetical protein
MKLNKDRTLIDPLLITNEGSSQVGRQVGRYQKSGRLLAEVYKLV